jgi:RND family efflux transporter MFP subunit
VAEFAAALLARPDVIVRAQIIADRFREFVPDGAVVVYAVEDQANPLWTAKATAGEIKVSQAVEFGTGSLGIILQDRTPQILHTVDLQREAFSHLDVRRTVTSLAYMPLVAGDFVVGAIEFISYDQPFHASLFEALGEALELATAAITTALNYESERNTSLQSISRVTQMYDLEKVFNATLEMDDLLEMIAKKFAEVMRVQAVTLWMVDGEAVQLVHQAGYDPTVSVGDRQKANDGIAGDISDSGDSVFIDDPADERLQKRNQGFEDAAIFSLVAAPLMELENLVGVVEAVNRLDGMPFDEDDQFLLMNICETASNALHNADLLQAERKLEVLQALVKVSGEITSTLDLDRVLQAVVTEPGTVINYERAAIAMEHHGKLQIRAVTGTARINPQDPNIVRLRELLEWASISSDPILVTQREEEIDADREETRAKFKTYFEQTGVRGFHSLPLADDDGRVGILSFESSDPDFLGTAHLEMVKVLAGQATVALRNASLYREVPFIDFIEPIMAKKRKFMALEKRRRALRIAAVAAVLVFLAVFPLQLRVDGPATVAPAHTAKIQPEVAGIIQSVSVREGDAVRAGTVLAKLDDSDYRMALAEAEAKYDTAVSQANRALATNDGTEAGIQRVQSQFWKSEVDRDRQRIDKTLLRAPIDGRVTTPHIEDMVGRSLSAGDTFAEVADTSHASVDVAIDEVDLARLESGDKAAVKLEGVPNETFHAPVAIVSPKAQLQGNDRFFYARLDVPNPQGLIRPGMQGRSKISTGWSPAGWVIFRRPAIWLWSKLWSWIGW